MKHTWFLSAVILGVVCPMVLFSMIKPDTAPSKTEQTEITTSAAEQSEINISLLLQDGTVKRIPLETYITCVVLKEMPVSFHNEALKAQAVVARTYTLRRLNGGSKHVGAVVCADPSCCQGYYDEQSFLENGGEESALDKVRQAVLDTAGFVLTYEGELIEATYFSCSGGMTEDALAVWGSDIPYLQAKESLGEEEATYYTDTVTFSQNEFYQKLGLNDYGETVRVDGVRYTDGGGVASLEICGQEFSGVEFRKLLGLRSTAFILSVVGNRIVITTKGYGHRVGMSQYGADAMAVQGHSFDEILFYYYTGTELIQHNPTD